MNKNAKILVALMTVAGLVSAIGFAVDFYNTLTYPGPDLRNRVVGARLMLEGIDPYFFKWQPGWSERFYDPMDNPTELVSKLSVPPTVLAVHAVMADLSYVQQRVIWLLAQWGAFIGTLLIFLKTSHSQAKKVLMLGASFFFANSLFWRLHISSGQIYVIYIFLLAIAWLFANRQSSYSRIISGFFCWDHGRVKALLYPAIYPFYHPKKVSFCFRWCAGPAV